jgi:prophage antirepressor-like protein
MNTPALCFNDVTFEVVDRNGSAWLKTSEVATALGYADQSGVTRIYSRNADEFTNEMTCSVKLTEHGQVREVRIFSLRGAHLIAMFARTAIAKQFRKWVLDILDKTVHAPMLISSTTKEDRIGVKDAITRLVATSKAMNYSQAYKLIHTAFDVDSIEQIPKDKLNVVVTYVNGLVGEYIPYEKPKPQGIAFDDQSIKLILHHVPYLWNDLTRSVIPALRTLDSRLAGSVTGHLQELMCHVNILQKRVGV